MSDDIQTPAACPAPALVRDAVGRFSKRRQRGGQAGNLNSTRNPWATYWRRRALRAEDRWVLALVEDYVPDLIAQKGGNREVTPAERRLMEIAGAARVCWLLCLARGDAASVRDAARFMAAEANALRTIGLDRKATDVPSLSAYLASRRTVDVPVTLQVPAPATRPEESMSEPHADHGEPKAGAGEAERPSGDGEWS